MYEIEECISRYRQLLDLMVDDSNKIEQGLQGELLDAYRGVVERERILLEDALTSIKTCLI